MLIMGKSIKEFAVIIRFFHERWPRHCRGQFLLRFIREEFYLLLSKTPNITVFV